MNHALPGPNQPRARELFFLLALCPALLAGCLAGPFLPYDDRDYVASAIVTGNAPLSDLFLKPAGACFPLTGLSFRIEYLFYHELLGVLHWAPFARLFNLLLHMFAGVIVWRICAALRLGRLGTLFVTGAFLLHPLACESVCWVSERKNTLAAPLGFGAVLLLLVPKWRWRLPAAALLYALALLAKPSALGFLPLLLALPLTKQRIVGKEEEDEGDGCARWRLFPFYFFLFTLSLVAVWFTLRAHAGMTVPPPGGSVFTAVLTDSEILRRYLQNAFWPAQLSAFYEVDPILSPLGVRFLANAGLVLAVVVLTIWLSRRRALSAFLWFWFFAALGPVLNLVSTSLLMQDRYLYFSEPALFAVLWLAVDSGSWLLAPGSLERRGATGPRAKSQELRAATAVWAVLITLAVLSACRSQVWGDAYRLFGDAARKQPRSVLANLCYADTLSRLADSAESQPGSASVPAGFRAQAIEHYQQACAAPDFKRLPSPGLLYLNLAHAQERSGHSEEAISTLRTLTSSPFNPPVSLEHGILAHERLALLYLRQKRATEALAAARAALVLSPDEPRALLLAGQSLEALGLPAEALAAYRRIKPEAPERKSAAGRIELLSAPPKP